MRLRIAICGLVGKPLTPAWEFAASRDGYGQLCLGITLFWSVFLQLIAYVDLRLWAVDLGLPEGTG
jgi:hypothetical protein